MKLQIGAVLIGVGLIRAALMRVALIRVALIGIALTWNAVLEDAIEGEQDPSSDNDPEADIGQDSVELEPAPGREKTQAITSLSLLLLLHDALKF